MDDGAWPGFVRSSGRSSCLRWRKRRNRIVCSLYKGKKYSWLEKPTCGPAMFGQELAHSVLGGVGIIGGGDSATAAAKWGMEDTSRALTEAVNTVYIKFILFGIPPCKPTGQSLVCLHWWWCFPWAAWGQGLAWHRTWPRKKQRKRRQSHMTASQNVKARSIPWTHRPIHTPDPDQNAGDPPIQTSGSPRADPYPNFDALPHQDFEMS